jgi:hypothetical protein
MALSSIQFQSFSFALWSQPEGPFLFHNSLQCCKDYQNPHQTLTLNTKVEKAENQQFHNFCQRFLHNLSFNTPNEQEIYFGWDFHCYYK